MIYRGFQDLNLSALGLGMMRLPVCNNKIDQAAAAEMVDYAIANGINYFDTAYMYHDGDSEIVTGKLLAKYPRDSFYLASKFPGFDEASLGRVEEIFEEQLKKCGVDYFDFYLFHNVCEKNIDGYLDKKYGIFDYLMKQKENGRIRHLGFSTHGSLETMERFLNAYGAHMEFCQIQLNYLDWYYQNAKEKVELLKKYNLPVWVMEPLRGGRLAQLPQADAAALTTLRPEENIPAWAFRFLQTLPEVTMVLSGMSNMEQLKANIATFSQDKPLNEKEEDVLLTIAKRMTAGVPCTACRYCTAKCPQELEIPILLNLYNKYVFSNGSFLPTDEINALDEDKRPSSCVGCRSCEAVCPQEIKISEVMADFAGKLNA